MFCLWFFPPSSSAIGFWWRFNWALIHIIPSQPASDKPVLTTASHCCQFADNKPDKSLEQTQRQAAPGSTKPLQGQGERSALYLLSWAASPDPWWGEFGRQLPFLGCALRSSSVHSGHRDLLLHPPVLPTTGGKNSTTVRRTRDAPTATWGMLFSSEEKNQTHKQVHNSTYCNQDTVSLNQLSTTEKDSSAHDHYLVTEGHCAIYVQTIFTLQLQQGVPQQFLQMTNIFFSCWVSLHLFICEYFNNVRSSFQTGKELGTDFFFSES